MISRVRQKSDKQRSLCHELVSIKNTNLLCKEIHKLEDLHKEIKNNTLALNELLPKGEAEEMAEKLETEEAVIFSIKKDMVKQMTTERRASEPDSQEAGESGDTKGSEEKVEIKSAKPDEDKLKGEVSRIQGRLENQLSLVEDLLLSADQNMMNRELQTLDRVYDDFVSAASNLREISSFEENKAVSKIIDAEDARVFTIKKSVSKWLAGNVEGVSEKVDDEKENKKPGRDTIGKEVKKVEVGSITTTIEKREIKPD